MSAPRSDSPRTAQQCAVEENAVQVALARLVWDEALPASVRAAIVYHAASLLARPATQHLDLYNLRIR